MLAENLEVKNHEGSALDEILAEKDSIKTEEVSEQEPSDEKSPGKEPVKPNKVEPPKKEAVEEKDLEPKTKTSDAKVKEDQEELLEQKMEKLEKALEDSKKWGHTNNRRLKNVSKMINNLKESASLTEEEYDKLSELLQTDSDEEEQFEAASNESPYGKLAKIANQRVSDLEELYEDDKFFRKKLAAFDSFVRYCSESEYEEIMEELEPLEKYPLKLAKKMYQMGEKFYNDMYKDVEEMGGLKSFIGSKNSHIEKLNKKIDKLEKKLLEYNDYDKPNLRIDELGETQGTSEGKPNDTVSEMLQERDRAPRR